MKSADSNICIFIRTFSLLDGYGTVKEYASRAKDIDLTCLCISDHGMMGAVPSQIAACEKHGLNAIFAVELFINPLQAKLETEEGRKAYKEGLTEAQKLRYRKSNHLLAIAYSEEGYKNLVRLSSWGYLYGWGGFPQRPRVNKEVLKQHREGLIFSSCCYASEIGWTFDTQGPDAAEDVVREYMEMFGENFRLEIMMLDFVKQKPYDLFIIKMHLKYHVPIFLSQDVHYARPEDSRMQQLMLMVQTKKTIQEIDVLVATGVDVFEKQDTQLWQKSETEINHMWSTRYSDTIDLDIFKAAKNETLNVCQKAKGVKLDRTIKLPQLPFADDRLLEEIRKGLKSRHVTPTKQVLSRIQEEYELIKRKGFSSYFLIEKMFTDKAREICPMVLGFGNGDEAVGPGRGSAVGAMTSYLLGITDVNPLDHDLLFSRFISEDRGRKMVIRFKKVEPITHGNIASC